MYNCIDNTTPADGLASLAARTFRCLKLGLYFLRPIMPVNGCKWWHSAWLSVTVYTSGTNVVQCKLTYADTNGHKRRQSSTMLNFQGQGKLTLAFQPIRKMPQGHRELMHCSAMATRGRIRWFVYTSMHDVACAGTCLLLLCNVYAQFGCLRPLTDARSINPALVVNCGISNTTVLEIP